MYLRAAGYEYGEIAASLGVSVSTVRSHISNARKQLSRTVARDWEGARLALRSVNHFAALRRRSLRLRWKMLWIQSPRLFRFLLAFNDRLPYRTRFMRNPTVTLR